MRFHPFKRFKQDMAGSPWKVVAHFSGYLVAALLMGDVLFGQGITRLSVVNSALALVLLFVLVRQ